MPKSAKLVCCTTNAIGPKPSLTRVSGIAKTACIASTGRRNIANATELATVVTSASGICGIARKCSPGWPTTRASIRGRCASTSGDGKGETRPISVPTRPGVEPGCAAPLAPLRRDNGANSVLDTTTGAHSAEERGHYPWTTKSRFQRVVPTLFLIFNLFVFPATYEKQGRCRGPGASLQSREGLRRDGRDLRFHARRLWHLRRSCHHVSWVSS